MDETKLMKELRQIRNAAILIALKSGATPMEVGTATGIGESNVRAMFPKTRRKKGNSKG